MRLLCEAKPVEKAASDCEKKKKNLADSSLWKCALPRGNIEPDIDGNELEASQA